MTNSKHKPNPRRAELRALSQQIKPLVKAGQFDAVNDGLVSIYSEETGQTTWHKFKEWKEICWLYIKVAFKEGQRA